MTTREPTHDTRGVPFPGTMWAIWDERGMLAAFTRFEEPVTATEALKGFPGFFTPLPSYTLAEFTEDRWAELMQAYEDGADTSKAKWIEP
jgi:hypothetical protein